MCGLLLSEIKVWFHSSANQIDQLVLSLILVRVSDSSYV